MSEVNLRAWALSVLPLGALMWSLFWSARFLPFPLRFNSGLVKIAVQLSVGLAAAFGFVGQFALYEHVLGTPRPLRHDYFFLISIYVESIGALAIGFNSDSVRRRKAKQAELNKTAGR
jgi:uncharacterized YccA/Bax inhibitor family protein